MINLQIDQETAPIPRTGAGRGRRRHAVRGIILYAVEQRMAGIKRSIPQRINFEKRTKCSSFFHYMPKERQGICTIDGHSSGAQLDILSTQSGISSAVSLSTCNMPLKGELCLLLYCSFYIIFIIPILVVYLSEEDI